jgi:hypothetical protein
MPIFMANSMVFQGFFIQINLALALVSINTGSTIMLKYILSCYISQLLKFTSYVGQFCPASDNHELP